MNTERTSSVEQRARIHAALGDASRLRIVEALGLGDASPSELAELVGMGSNLLAHHLKVLEEVNLVARRRSDGDARRVYLRLRSDVLANLTSAAVGRAERVVFVCTANSARSHLAAAMWRASSSPLPVASAGTHPGPSIAVGARRAALRHGFELPSIEPVELASVTRAGDLIVTVCDNAHEELDGVDQLHWSVPDPVPEGTKAAYDLVIDDLDHRILGLVSHLN